MNNIKIKLPDGSIKEFEMGITPFEIAQKLSNRLAEDAVVAKVDDVAKDLSTKIYNDARLEILTFDDPEGKHTYWHSTSHLMAHAVQSIYPEAKFGVGPAIDSGFYYDIDINSTLSEEDLVKIENKMLEIAKQKNPFKRTELKKEEAVKFFEKKGDNYKLEILSELDDANDVISIYDEGDFTDLCTGPHVPDVGKIKYLKLLNVSGSYWRGDEHNKRMQRIYGISFPKKKMLDDYLLFLEEAKKRDHRKIGKALDLFSIHEEAGAGLIYWHPKGARIRNTIETFWREQHLSNGYELLYTPHLGKSWLWETSGHLGFYKESMYSPMSIDEQNYFIKPMNCPFHIMIYKTKLRSYRDLPLRWSELGTVYRYEKSGVLHGLLRVRGFTQDDAHLFCTHEQMEDEIIEVVRFSRFMLKSFGFDDLAFYVATKPEGSVGNDESWVKATQSLMKALDKENLKYQIDEGGGAFYGPKIDIKIKDALKREWQLSTIQFDFNEPARFEMKYIGEDGKEHQPFMIHRALLGSIERFMGILIEHYAGAFPTWLAPVQAAIIPVSQNHFEYAKHVADELKKNNIIVELDERNEKIGYKIRDWETQKVPYMLIVGEKEKESNSVSVRQHKLGDKGTMTVTDFAKQITDEIKNKINHY
ncbi:MAG: threonine--tRNA ligase [Bacteroidota bacterium]